MSREPARTLSIGAEQSGSRQHSPADCWLQADDGYAIFYRHYRGRPGRPAILYLHGIEGHSGWFAPTAEFLHRLGMSVYAADRRGAGRNQAERGRLKSYRQLTADLRLLIGQVRQWQPDSPLFVIGNCWGAKTAVAALQDEQIAGQVSGLVLTSPAIGAKVDFPLVTKLAVGCCWLLGCRHRFALPIAPEQFTDNPRYIEFIRSDPERLTEAEASLLVENLTLSRIVRIGAARLTLPVLVLQAGADVIVDVRAVRQWFAQVPARDKELRIFADSAHSLDFDANPEEYRQCLSGWIEVRARRSPACE